MRIGSLCTRNVIHTGTATPLLEAARTLRTQQIGALIVTSTSDRGPVPVGILTDRDIVMALVDSDHDVRMMTVGDAMAPAPAACSEQDDLFDVISLMRRRGIRRVPVVDDAGVLVGIVSVDDVLGALAEHVGELARALISDELIEVRRHAR